MIQSPGLILLLFCFLIFPLIIGGHIKEKAASTLACFITAILSFPITFSIYLLLIGLFFSYK